MIRILLVEDEFIERAAMKKLISKYFFKYFIVADEASTGAEAVLFCQENDYDVIFMDILMPIMDGIEAARIIRHKTDVEIIFITAFATFEYAQQALRLGGVDYLVKPYSMKSLEDILNRVKQAISKKRSLEVIEAKKNTRLNELTEMIEREFIIKVIHEKHIHQSMLEDYLVNIDINGKYFFCGILRFKNYIDVADEKSVKGYLKSFGFKVIATSIFDLFIFWGFDDSIEDIYESKKKLIKNNIGALGIGSGGNIVIKFELGEPASDFYRIHETYNQVYELIEGNKSSDKVSNNEKDMQQLEKTYCDCLMLRDLDSAVKTIHSIVMRQYGIHQNQITKVINYFYAFDGYILRILQQFSGNDIEFTTLSQNAGLKKCSSFKELNVIMQDYTEGLIMQMEQLQTDRNDVIIQAAKVYIRDNYMNNIGLEEVADSIGLSKSYLSRTFSKVEKMNFKEYVTMIRMERAIEMLVQGSYTVAEVAYEIGFQDAANFSKAFKKYSGKSPKEMKLSE